MNSRASTGAHHPTVLAMSWSNALHCLYTADEMGRVGVWRMVDLLKKANMKPVLNSAETPIKVCRRTDVGLGVIPLDLGMSLCPPPPARCWRRC